MNTKKVANPKKDLMQEEDIERKWRKINDEAKTGTPRIRRSSSPQPSTCVRRRSI